ncbi:uncharacterized protein [Nicotiana tomentosiformis]|uniref:uncharacterized protein n=1 Tax=Nicotiana tomentosiformis TaxID=4098 RepID=UPI00388C8EB4
MIHDACGYTNVKDNNSNNSVDNEKPNVHATKFYKLLEDAETELYPGCKKVSKLSFVVKLLHLKCLNHWRNIWMDALLRFFREVIPEGSFVPIFFYEAKKVFCDLGLGYTKIDACQKDCILYWRDYTDVQACPKCGKSRWKSKEHGVKKVAHKILPHFSIKPRLQRLYMARESTKKMRWNKEKSMDDGVLRYPSDSVAYKSFDARHPTFSAELRNVRLGLAKLKELWDRVETYDAHSKSNFMMRVAIMWTINDFPAYGNFSGWSTKGKLACPCCHKDTQSTSLRSKLCYMGHRHFLPMDHPWRRSRTLFDGKVEMGVAPNPLRGDEALVQLQALGNVTFSKGQKRKRDFHSNAYNWKKKSIFFQLPY